MFSDRIFQMIFDEALRRVRVPAELIDSQPIEMDFWDWADYFYCNRN